MKRNTTKANFELFKEACLYYIDLIGLSDWEVTYEHAAKPIDEYLAWCTADEQARAACLGLNINFAIDPTDKAVIGCAKHEVIELLVAPLDVIARRRYVNETEIESARHAIVRRLEQLMEDYEQ